MTVREIVKEYLEKNGYDGLCCDFCSCDLSSLMPCDGDDDSSCEAGYFIKMEKCKKCENYSLCMSQEKDSTECPCEMGC